MSRSFGHRRLRHHADVHAGAATDLFRAGWWLRGLRPLVQFRAHRDVSQSGLRVCRDQSGSHGRRQASHHAEHLRADERARTRLVHLRLHNPPLTRIDSPTRRPPPESHFGLFQDFQAAAAARSLGPYVSGTELGIFRKQPAPQLRRVARRAADSRRVLHPAQRPAWNQTLLIVTYDEHGGCYYHVPPPAGAVPPDKKRANSDSTSPASVSGCRPC